MFQNQIKTLLKQTEEMQAYWSVRWVMTSTAENSPTWYRSTGGDPGLSQQTQDQDGSLLHNPSMQFWGDWEVVIEDQHKFIDNLYGI